MSDSDSDHNGLSLFRACQKGHVRRVTKLLQYGADIEEKSPTGYFGLLTPLQIAVLNIDLELTELLLDNGADMSVIYENGESLLIRAARTMKSPSHEMADLLIRRGADMSYTHTNITRQGGSSIKNKMPPGSNDWNALHVAAYCGRCEFVEVLIQRGAVITTLTSRGETALDLALMQDYLKKEFNTYNRSEVERYIQNCEDFCFIGMQTRRYLRHLRGYDETVRLLQIAEKQLAFAMGQHPRIGRGSALANLSPDEVRMILEIMERDKVQLDPRDR